MELSSQHQMSHHVLEEAIMASKMDTPYLNEVYFPNMAWTTTFDQTPDDHDLHPHHHFPNSVPPTNLGCLPYSNNSIYSSPFGELHPFLDILTSPDYASYHDNNDDLTTHLSDPLLDSVNVFEDAYKVESTEIGVHHNNMDHIFSSVDDVYGDRRRCKVKKPDGQPSKNLMAERRRRKRLNDRLSMLRSIVPKISKMDRTSILGDTIDYMRELLDKIRKLREEGFDNDNANPTKEGCVKEIKPNEMLVRNPPKFDVARGNNKLETRVEVCCSAKPGLVLSTLNTMDALGLDVQQCVISCFNDFSLQASCLDQGDENEAVLRCEDMKQALFRNAGYGGRCV